MDTEVQNLRVQTQELEEELTEAENSRLRLEVNLQALKAQFEREISTNEEKGEEKRRALSKQVERKKTEESTGMAFTFCPSHSYFSFMFPCLFQVKELEIHLEEERTQRSQAVLAKKQLEAELQESEAQVETATRGKEEAVKQLRRLQVKRKSTSTNIRFLYTSTYTSLKCIFNLSQGQMKEVLRELDETKISREEVIAQSKDSEKKIQTLEAEVLHLTEVCGFTFIL